MNNKYILTFIAGLFIGILGILGILGISLQITKIQEIVVRTLFDKGVKSVPHDGEHVIELTLTDREPPQLSITKVRLIDDSGSEKYELRSNDEGMIECTIRNKGGTAKSVSVVWELSAPNKLPEQLKLVPPTKDIPELRKNSFETYKISVKTIDMKYADHFKINLYPFHNGQRTYDNPEEFTFNVSPEL